MLGKYQGNQATGVHLWWLSQYQRAFPAGIVLLQAGHSVVWDFVLSAQGKGHMEACGLKGTQNLMILGPMEARGLHV